MLEIEFELHGIIQISVWCITSNESIYKTIRPTASKLMDRHNAVWVLPTCSNTSPYLQLEQTLRGQDGTRDSHSFPPSAQPSSSSIPGRIREPISEQFPAPAQWWLLKGVTENSQTQIQKQNLTSKCSRQNSQSVKAGAKQVRMPINLSRIGPFYSTNALLLEISTAKSKILNMNDYLGGSNLFCQGSSQ